MRLILHSALLSTLLVGCASAHVPTGDKEKDEKSYAHHQLAEAFVEEMVSEGFDRTFLEQTFAVAERQDSILKAISRPAEKRLDWGGYRNIFLGQSRIDQGVEFWNEHQETLQRASEVYGVPVEIIVAIIGVETRYGRHAGNYRVVDALATLAFDYPPRSQFFRGQLKELFALSQEENLPIDELKGSYAGAMGYGQFIPSSYRHYAVDFDGDDQRNILTNPVDAIGSVANYFAEHNWRTNEAVTAKVELQQAISDEQRGKGLKPVKTLQEWGELGVILPQAWQSFDPASKATLMKMEIDGATEYWLGLDNFYVITRYNHSHLYAMAVYQLSQAVIQAKKAAESS